MATSCADSPAEPRTYAVADTLTLAPGGSASLFSKCEHTKIVNTSTQTVRIVWERD